MPELLCQDYHCCASGMPFLLCGSASKIAKGNPDPCGGCVELRRLSVRELKLMAAEAGVALQAIGLGRAR